MYHGFGLDRALFKHAKHVEIIGFYKVLPLIHELSICFKHNSPHRTKNKWLPGCNGKISKKALQEVKRVCEQLAITRVVLL